MTPQLRIFWQYRQQRQLWLPLTGALIFGFSADADIQLPDPCVSSVHCLLLVTDEGASLRDLGSRNGTRVNGTPLRHVASLQSGDLIQIGYVTILYEAEDVASTRGAGQL